MEFKLTDIIKNQAILNVGCIGSVSHGKSSMVKCLTGIKTQKHSKELERNITINLGYANIKIYYNKDTKSFQHFPGEGYELYRHISFVDCPGHKALSATMISGSRVMNAAILIIAVNESIPQPQTLAHTDVLKHTDINNVLVVPNKVDLLEGEKDTTKRTLELKNFMDNNIMLKGKNVIPISAFKNINIEQITRYLSTIPSVSIQEKVNENFSMYVLRTFDVNYVNTPIADLKGGVVGGSIVSGYVKIGDTVMLAPGIIVGNTCRPIIAKVISIFSEKTPLSIAFPGGLIALGLDCDPSLCKQNLLLGNSIIKLDSKKSLPVISKTIVLDVNYLKTSESFQNLTNIIILVNSRSIKCKVTKRKEKKIVVELDTPIVVTMLEVLPLMTIIGDTVELFGLGTIVDNVKSELEIVYPIGFNDLETNDVQSINIIDDLPIVEFDSTCFTIDHLKNNIMPHIRSARNSTIIFPELTIIKETMRFIWSNYKVYSDLFDNKYSKQNLDDQLRIYCIKQIIGEYVRYIYNKDENSISITNDHIILHTKTRGLKLKPEVVIKNFFDKYYSCQCSINNYTCRIGKIGSKVMKVCFECAGKKIINEPWVSFIKFT